MKVADLIHSEMHLIVRELARKIYKQCYEAHFLRINNHPFPILSWATKDVGSSFRRVLVNQTPKVLAQLVGHVHVGGVPFDQFTCAPEASRGNCCTHSAPSSERPFERSSPHYPGDLLLKEGHIKMCSGCTGSLQVFEGLGSQNCVRHKEVQTL
ncbi:MAG: hypothetical protein M3256_11100 [Actinomycetota bacterium]|nr:hypothetical protein [Actinomycetota bacterium]